MAASEPGNADAVTVSAFRLRPASALAEFAAELRQRLDRAPAGAECAPLATMLAAAETEIGLRQRQR